ncbi:MAG TPA: N-6 DNA methylase [Thermoanaerobaculia bacterium]|nr:N-6 DNA methylase [Thermoanaerobaculia bacterium]
MPQLRLAFAPGAESDLAGLALALGARRVEGWSAAEERLAVKVSEPEAKIVKRIRLAIERGEDPLGEQFCALRSAGERRLQGATYTPEPIVAAMTLWAQAQPAPDRIVDPGAGSGRFLVTAGRAIPQARLVGVEIDPLAALLARAQLAVHGMAGRSQILVGDYREVVLSQIAGRTLFLGNPPYVRHHLISPSWKAWMTKTAAGHGLAASQLAGLHVHFLLATLEIARPGDLGAFITAAEWLDVNYGRLVRELLLQKLGGRSLHVIEPELAPFPDAAATGVVFCFEVGSKASSLRFKRVEDLASLNGLRGGRPIRRERLEAASRWSVFTRKPKVVPAGLIELGELCQVHRGQVTGANRVWIAGAHSFELPRSVLFPSVTKARDLLTAGPVLVASSGLRQVIDLPADLGGFEPEERRRIERFLRAAKGMGADQGYVATHRRAWWSVGLRSPAPILTTYMARRAPAFVRNLAGARHINIAHGIYPRVPMSDRALEALTAHLARTTHVDDGRTYAGGLTKFEPGELERIAVPSLDQLEAGISP